MWFRWFKQQLWMWLAYNALSEIKLSNNKLSNNKLSDNNLASELVENRSFLTNHNWGNCNFYDSMVKEQFLGDYISYGLQWQQTAQAKQVFFSQKLTECLLMLAKFSQLLRHILGFTFKCVLNCWKTKGPPNKDA